MSWPPPLSAPPPAYATRSVASHGKLPGRVFRMERISYPTANRSRYYERTVAPAKAYQTSVLKKVGCVVCSVFILMGAAAGIGVYAAQKL